MGKKKKKTTKNLASSACNSNKGAFSCDNPCKLISSWSVLVVLLISSCRIVKSCVCNGWDWIKSVYFTASSRTVSATHYVVVGSVWWRRWRITTMPSVTWCRYFMLRYQGFYLLLLLHYCHQYQHGEKSNNIPVLLWKKKSSFDLVDSLW